MQFRKLSLSFSTLLDNLVQLHLFEEVNLEDFHFLRIVILSLSLFSLCCRSLHLSWFNAGQGGNVSIGNYICILTNKTEALLQMSLNLDGTVGRLDFGPL